MGALGTQDANAIRQHAAEKTAQEIEKMLPNKSLFSDLWKGFTNRFRQMLEGVIQALPEKKDQESSPEGIKTLWGYILYYSPADDLVRRGDIVLKSDGQWAMVINQCCDLNNFWKKCLGSVVLVPLRECTPTEGNLLERLARTWSLSDCKTANPTSLTNPGNNYPDGYFYLPFVDKISKDCMLIGNGKEITSSIVGIPERLSGADKKGELKKAPLQYSDWPNISRKCTLAEPYAGELTLFCLKSLMGWGVIDFPKIVRDSIKETFAMAVKDR